MQVSFLKGTMGLHGTHRRILVRAWALRCSENKIRDAKIKMKCVAKEQKLILIEKVTVPVAFAL